MLFAFKTDTVVEIQREISFNFIIKLGRKRDLKLITDIFSVASIH